MKPFDSPRTAVLFLALIAAACGPTVETADSDAPARAAVDDRAAYRPTEAQRAQILAAVQSLFDALRTGDEALLRATVDPSVVMHSSETRDGRTTFATSTVDGLAQRISASEVPLIERMWNPDVVVNGPMATVWTPYDFYVGAQFSHCGVDSVLLMEREGRWTIVGLSWTRMQPPMCALHPDGPPSM